MNVLLGALALSPHVSVPASPRPVPQVIQARVESVTGFVMVVTAPGPLEHGRQVDFASARFESAAGVEIPRFVPRPGQRLLVVADPWAPTVEGPRPNPHGGLTPMWRRLLPLKAWVIERLG